MLAALAAGGCAHPASAPVEPRPPVSAVRADKSPQPRRDRTESPPRISHREVTVRSSAAVIPVAHEEPAATSDATTPIGQSMSDLAALSALALASNPRLQQMQQEAAAAWQRVRYVGALPDPMLGGAGIVPPMQFADGQQFAMASFNQRLPWLQRLGAQEQQACFAAWALESAWQAERLKTVAEVKVAYSRLYVVDQQVRINRGNQDLIQLLIDVANDKVVAQSATEGDVLLGTLELSRLTEEMYALEERRASLQAGLNRLLNRAAETPVAVATELSVADPSWTLDTLRQTAWAGQPEIAAAQLRATASEWGLRVAELERRPEVTLGVDWIIMDQARPPGEPAFGGIDSWQIGAMVSVPIWRKKYDAMRDEAARMRIAAQFSVEDVQRQYEALLAELREQARAAAKTARLYNDTMLPQARRTFEADQRAYVGPGTVEFDRVIEDFRTVLTLEEGYHRAIGDWAVALARIEQAVARDLVTLPVPPPDAPPTTHAADPPALEIVPMSATAPAEDPIPRPIRQPSVSAGGRLGGMLHPRSGIRQNSASGP